MKCKLMFNRRLLMAALVVLGALSVTRLNASAGEPKLIALGTDYAIHQFKGFVRFDMVESIVRPGVVISHTNLKTAKMSWLVATGIHSIPTRRISYSVTRLVGLEDDDKHLVVVVFSSGRVFTKGDRPPMFADPKNGQYLLTVFDKAKGKSIYSTTLRPAASALAAVPKETIDSGVIRKTKKGFEVFGSLFIVQESGKIDRQKITPRERAPEKRD